MTTPRSWRYKEGATGHDAGFQASAFDDSSWAQGDQPFGLNDLSYGGPISTPWAGHNDDLCLRAHLDVPADATAVRLLVTIDFSGTVYVNGASIGTVAFSDLPYKTFDLASWNVGDNVIAVRAHADANQNRFAMLVAIDQPGTAWHVYDADALLGAPIATLENGKGRWIRSELNGLGEGGFTINRHVAEATEGILAEGNMVKVRIADCGSDYIDGFFLGPDGDYALLSAQGGKGAEHLVFHGDGALSYLDRARMLPCSFSLEDAIGTWTKVWATTAVNRPVGVAYDSAMSGYVFVGGLGSRKVKKLNQSTRAVVASSAALWPGDKAMGGISFDPDDATIMWVLEAPWLLGSSANTKIRKYSRAASGLPGTLLASYDLGSDVQLTDIRVDGDYVWTSRYDNDRIQQRSKSNPATVVNSSTITYKGKVQRKPNGIAINGSKVAYWFGGDGGGGTGRALIADTSAYTTITGKQNTRNVSAFGGEWTTEGGDDFLYAVSYTAGKTWKYQLTDAIPRCADDSGTFHPDQVAPGSIAWRVLVEITHPDRPLHECPELSFSFTEDEDSNGTPWPARTSTEEFTWRVGDRAFTDLLARLIPAGVLFDLDVNTMTLHAYVDTTFGTDRTSATFGSGKVRFEEGVNLGVNGDLGRRDNRGQPDTYMTVAGDGGVYGAATLTGRYVRHGFMQVSGPTTSAVLNAIGDDELARERLVADALGFETLWGDSEDPDAGALVGKYMPKRHVWKGDLVRVDMDAGEFAYDEVDFRVYGTLITERDGKQAEPGGDVTPGWRSAIDLGSKYKIPPPIESVPGTGSTGSSSGGGSSGGRGSTVITSIPLTVTDPDRGISIPRVTELRAPGVMSPSPGVAVLPDATATTDPDSTGLGSYVFVASENGCALDSDLDTGGGTDDTAALQALLDVASSGGRVMVILDGPALVSGLDVYSNTTLLTLAGCGLYLADGSDRAIIRNANRSRGAVTDHDISIFGGRYNGNRANQSGGGATGHQEADDTFMSGMQFFGVSYLTLRDVDVVDTEAFGINIGNAEQLNVDGYFYDWGGVGTPHTSTNQDALHLNGPISGAYLANLRGTSNDDFLAICAGDDSTADMTSGPGLNVQGPYVGQGPITDLIVDGVALEACLSGIRLLSHDTNSRIDRLQIRNVTGTVVDQAVLITSFGVGDGSVGHVEIDGLDVVGDPSTGSAEPSLIQLDNTCEDLVLRNIAVQQPADDRPFIWLRPTAVYDSITIDGLSCYDVIDNGAAILPIKIDGHVKRLRINSVNWVRFAPAAHATALIAFGNAASQCDGLFLDGIQVNGVDYIVNHTAGTIASIQAAHITHHTTGTNASFRTTGTIALITLSNWSSDDGTPTSGTFTTRTGDAFGSGASTLDDLSDVVLSSPAVGDRLRFDGTDWVNTTLIWKPVMDGSGNVVTDSGTGAAIMTEVVP